MREATRILVLNAGSSSVKYQLIEMLDGRRLAVGLVEKIGERTGRLVHTPVHGERRESERVFADHAAALKAVAAELAADGVGLDSRSWPRSATGWCTAASGSPHRP